jgi:hypothetical protein
MNQQFNENSMLRQALSYEDREISSILFETERNIRAMCRLMQVYDEHGCDGIDSYSYDELHAVFGTFYAYVDRQMEAIAALAYRLEGDFSWVSLNKLRECGDFQKRPVPREAFVSREAYEHWCDENGWTPEPETFTGEQK